MRSGSCGQRELVTSTKEATFLPTPDFQQSQTNQVDPAVFMGQRMSRHTRRLRVRAHLPQVKWPLVSRGQLLTLLLLLREQSWREG
jgi:hypothetical protein